MDVEENSEGLAKIRATLFHAIQETERIEEAFQGSKGSVNERLSSLVKQLALIDEQASLLDPDHLTIQRDILVSLALQNSDSVKILSRVKDQIDRSAQKARAQIIPVAHLRERIKYFLQHDQVSLIYKDTIQSRGLLIPPFFRE